MQAIHSYHYVLYVLFFVFVGFLFSLSSPLYHMPLVQCAVKSAIRSTTLIFSSPCSTIKALAAFYTDPKDSLPKDTIGRGGFGTVTLVLYH